MEQHINKVLTFHLSKVLAIFLTSSLVEAQINLGRPEPANGRLLPIIGHQDFHLERPQTFQRPKELGQFELSFEKSNIKINPKIHGIEKIITDHKENLKAAQANPENILNSRDATPETPEDRSAPKFGIPKSMGHLFSRPAGTAC